jgi:hypothetical protein
MLRYFVSDSRPQGLTFLLLFATAFGATRMHAEVRLTPMKWKGVVVANADDPNSISLYAASEPTNALAVRIVRYSLDRSSFNADWEPGPKAIVKGKPTTTNGVDLFMALPPETNIAIWKAIFDTNQAHLLLFTEPAQGITVLSRPSNLPDGTEFSLPAAFQVAREASKGYRARAYTEGDLWEGAVGSFALLYFPGKTGTYTFEGYITEEDIVPLTHKFNALLAGKWSPLERALKSGEGVSLEEIGKYEGRYVEVELQVGLTANAGLFVPRSMMLIRGFVKNMGTRPGETPMVEIRWPWNNLLPSFYGASYFRNSDIIRITPLANPLPQERPPIYHGIQKVRPSKQELGALNGRPVEIRIFDPMYGFMGSRGVLQDDSAGEFSLRRPISHLLRENGFEGFTYASEPIEPDSYIDGYQILEIEPAALKSCHFPAYEPQPAKTIAALQDSLWLEFVAQKTNRAVKKLTADDLFAIWSSNQPTSTINDPIYGKRAVWMHRFLEEAVQSGRLDHLIEKFDRGGEPDRLQIHNQLRALLAPLSQ